MISEISKVDLSQGKRYRRKRDGLEVVAVEMQEDFQIVLPDNHELRDHVRIEHEVVEEDGRKLVMPKEIPCQLKIVHAYGGTIRGRRGDYIAQGPDGFVFAISNRPKETREAPEALFENTFDPI